MCSDESPRSPKIWLSYPTSETKHTVKIYHYYALKSACRASLLLVQVWQLRSVLSPQAPGLDCWITVRRNFRTSISMMFLCDCKSSNNANYSGAVEIFPLLPFAKNAYQTRPFTIQGYSIMTLSRHKAHEKQGHFCDVTLRCSVLCRSLATIVRDYQLHYNFYNFRMEIVIVYRLPSPHETDFLCRHEHA